MANPPMGDDFSGGDLGVVRIIFDGNDLGDTMDDTTVEMTEDLKEIKKAQKGTRPVDYVPTGAGWTAKFKIAEQTWARMSKIIRGLTVLGHNVKLGLDLYRSAYQNFAKRLILARIDSEGSASADAFFRLTFYKAFLRATGPAFTFGPEQQKVVEVEALCLYDTGKKAFGFAGHASSLGL